jgi:hypothetical protein
MYTHANGVINEVYCNLQRIGALSAPDHTQSCLFSVT